MTQGEFIQKVAPLAVKYGKEYDIPPSVIIAQAYLESAYGNSFLTKNYNNLVGMKAYGKVIPGIWDGKKIMLPTSEEKKGGEVVKVNEPFRVYNSWDESIADLANRHAKRFKLTLTRFNNDEDLFLDGIVNSGYATDSKYKGKLNGIINTFNLKKFDNLQVMPGTQMKSTKGNGKKKVGGRKTKRKLSGEAA